MKRLLLALAFVLGVSVQEASALGAFVQSCHKNSAGGPGNKSNSNACTMTVTAGNFIVMIAGSNGGGVANADNSGCGDNNGGVYVYAILSTVIAPNKICYAMNHAGGSTTFTYTNQALDWSYVDVAEFSGMATSSGLDQVAEHGTAAPSANAVTGTTSATTNAADVAVTTLNNGVQGAMTCPSGYTQIDQVDTFNTDVSWCTCYKVLSATGTQSGTYTSPSAAHGAAIAVFKQQAGFAAGQGLLPWLR